MLKESKVKIENEAFFLVSSGKSRLRSNNMLGVYSEFVLAHKIEPKNEEIINLLIETSYSLCKNDKVYCEALETYLALSL